jgi:hypothetical protein
MNPILYATGITILTLALAASIGAIIATVLPARGKIVRALWGRRL